MGGAGSTTPVPALTTTCVVELAAVKKEDFH